MTRIKSDEGELDALATYLEAVQVFLRQHIHSNSLSADLLTGNCKCCLVWVDALCLG